MAVSHPEIRGGPLDIDGGAFAENFARHPFPVRHSLVEHPLLTLDALAELADRLPLRSIERHRADLDLMTPGGAPELEGPPSQTVREIDTANAWMVLWYIEQDPAYKALLDECLDEVERFVGDRHGGMQYRRGYIFISAPNATTPVHFDPEQNLLLQIRGRKEMNLGRFADPADQEAELERYFAGGHRNLDRMPDLERQFVMEPGRRRLRLSVRSALGAQQPEPVDLAVDHLPHRAEPARRAHPPCQRAPAPAAPDAQATRCLALARRGQGAGVRDGAAHARAPRRHRARQRGDG